MLIRRLVLENYGLFAGRHEFDLAPRTRDGKACPIVLFGGKNGAGKTTILEAIRLVLYGRLSLGGRVRSVDYDAFLRGRVHRNKLELLKSHSAKIAIDFDHVHRGTRDRYLVERSWNTANSVIDEHLSVMRNDKQLEEVDSEFWQGFVRDIIPEGLSQLFFFDGEKIRELAEDATGSGVLADSIKSLLGLDLVERLNADLSVYTSREVAKLGAEEDRSKLSELERQIHAHQAKIVGCNEDLAANRTKLDGVHAEIRRAEEGLRQEGEDLASRRSRLQTEEVTLAAKIEHCEKTLREECESVFPFALCPRVSKALRKQLAQEQDQAHKPRVDAALNEARAALMRKIQSARPPLTKAALAAVRAAVESTLAQRKKNDNMQVAAPFHRLSDGDLRRVIGSLNEANKSREHVADLCTQLEKLRHRLELVERNLAQIPTDEAVRPHIAELTDLSRRFGALEQARTEAEERLRQLRFELEVKDRERRNIVERYHGGLAIGKRIETARAVQGALGDYLKRLTHIKVQQLRETVARCFNRLCRKGDIVDRIEINPTSFAVTLFNSQNQAIPKEELSSGEKQIFSIALLWGLAQTSGRPLPVIIDTPLGRLDSDHRLKLIEEYFPHASHQVVLLSTDTEVDEELFEQLSPWISHSYQLVYRNDSARSESSTGYFWREATNA